MGILDDMTSVVNRGVDAAGRTGRAARLKMKLSELSRQRRELATQLGMSLYDDVRHDANLRAGRETIIDGIERIDEQRVQIEQQINVLEGNAVATSVSTQPDQPIVCTNCGTQLPYGLGFCTGCGMPREEILATANSTAETDPDASGRVCVACGAPIPQDGALFCAACGARQPL